MTQYQGKVQSYVLEIQSPNSPYNQKGVISLHGAFGLAILYFVPQDGVCTENPIRIDWRKESPNVSAHDRAVIFCSDRLDLAI
jgi:hypothetical protein